MSELKQRVAALLASRVKDNDVIGIGSGTTAEEAILKIGARIRDEKIRVRGIPTSYRSAVLASQAGIEILNPLADITLEWAFDGADEVDPSLNMIKGKGAAMLSEKIIARRAKRLVIIVGEDKLVDRLGSKFAVPVEVIPAALGFVQAELKRIGATEVELRNCGAGKCGPVVTEHNNLIVDARFSSLSEAQEREMKAITGVVETGLFLGFNPEVLIANSVGLIQRQKVNGAIRDTNL